ncbi:MAG: MFS transporter [Marinilabiliales bacterium]|nr:MFS transporter [Marinilabiliales bacterium]
MVKANEAGIKVAFIPLVYLLTNLVSVLAAIPLGSLSDRVGKEKILVAGFLLYALVYFWFGRTSDASVIIALFALYGLYSAATDGIQKAFCLRYHSTRTSRAPAWASTMQCLEFTLLLASIIAGVLYDKAGPGVPFYFGGAMAFMAFFTVVVFCIRGKPVKNV